MKNRFKLFLVWTVISAFALIPLVAAAEDTPGHDFGGSEVYTLNIIAAKEGFNCQQSGSGNAVYVPMNGNNIQVLVQAVPGKRDGRIPPLQVLDSCTASIDGTPAVVQIPKNAHGYAVYARPMSKTGIDPLIVVSPPLKTVKDEAGNILVYLGELTVNGMIAPNSELSKKRGQWAEQDISPLLEWSGNICSPYYYSSASTKQLMCCTPGNPATGSKFGTCTAQNGVCPSGTMTVPVYCKTYTEEWLLGIPEFAQFFSGKTFGGQQLVVEFHALQ